MIGGSILAALLLACLVLFLIFKKRKSALPEESPHVEELDEEFDEGPELETTYTQDDGLFASEYGLSDRERRSDGGELVSGGNSSELGLGHSDGLSTGGGAEYVGDRPAPGEPPLGSGE